MEILTDNEGTSWRLTGTPNQVTVERRPPLTQDEVAKGLTIADKAWRAASYHNRMDHAMSWLLDQILRMELDEAEAGQFVALVSGWKAKLETWLTELRPALVDSEGWHLGPDQLFRLRSWECRCLRSCHVACCLWC